MKNNKKKKYEKPALKIIKIKDINIKVMEQDFGQFCMMTTGNPCHV